MKIDIRLGDCLEVLKTIPDNSIDSVVTDPPYGLGFMNKEWDSPEKLRALTQRESDRSAERKAEGKSPTDAPFSKSVPPGLAIKGAKEGKWFQEWCELWAVECLRILKPGGHILSFSAPRTYHRMATAFEDAGFEIRDQLMWVFGSGFPKSHNIGKAIDKIEGNEREVVGRKIQRVDGTTRNLQPNGGFMKENVKTKPSDGYIDIEKPGSDNSERWEGWGTALKPAHEPIVMARKPLSEKSIAENVLKHGTGGINIDGSRIPFEDTQNAATNPKFRKENNYKMPEPGQESNGAVKFTSSNNEYDTSGRFPANIIFDEEAGQLLDEQSGTSKSGFNPKANKKQYKGGVFGGGETNETTGYTDKGGASRFFYCPKAAKSDRNEGLDDFEKKKSGIGSTYAGNQKTSNISGNPDRQTDPKANHHPTVKPTDLMRYLINLVTPPNGTILDPFMGSGSTGKAAVRCGVNFIGIEKEQEYMDIASARIEHEQNKPVQTKLF
jgi:site-specific DNA-methyltransferase (adenine-specific)